MGATNKTELLRQLNAERACLDACIHAAYIVASRAWTTAFHNYTTPGTIDICFPDTRAPTDVNRITIPNPSYLIRKYSDDEVLNTDGLNILRLGHRNALSQYFEKIRQYCRSERSAGVRLSSTAWYDFVRVVRNSFSHDFHLNDRLLATKPIQLRFSDRAVTLNKRHQAKEIDFGILPMRYIVELLDMMQMFVEKEL